MKNFSKKLQKYLEDKENCSTFAPAFDKEVTRE